MNLNCNIPNLDEELLKFNNTKKVFNDDITIQELFQEQVKKEPNATALIFGDKKLTYKELDEKSNSLAWIIRNKGINVDDIVAISTNRSFEMIIGIYAIIKAGAAYLPIAVNNPIDRTEYILQESQCKLIISDRSIKETLNNNIDYIDINDANNYEGNKKELPLINKSSDLAYVIYTSGSTGKPKGVMIEHKSLVNRLTWMQEKYSINSSDLLIQKTPFAFDVSVWEMFWWAIVGSKLFILDPNMEKFPQAILMAIEEQKITVIHFVPSMLEVFLDYIIENKYEDKLKSLKQVFCSGEKLTVNQVKKFNQSLGCKNNTKLSNLYGPTETTIDVTYFDCPKENDLETIPIGKPINNINILILNENNEMKSIGEIGEICVAGVGLARGYLNRPDLTKEAFIKYGQDTNLTIYKTGDLGRWMKDGNVEYIGRKDFQVKISGLRIELSEIERVIETYNDGIKCVVVAKKITNAITHINAFLQVNNKSIDIKELRKFLLRLLPNYMIPFKFNIIDKIPLTDNGKVDRKYLRSISS